MTPERLSEIKQFARELSALDKFTSIVLNELLAEVERLQRTNMVLEKAIENSNAFLEGLNSKIVRIIAG